MTKQPEMPQNVAARINIDELNFRLIAVSEQRNEAQNSAAMALARLKVTENKLNHALERLEVFEKQAPKKKGRPRKKPANGKLPVKSVPEERATK